MNTTLGFTGKVKDLAVKGQKRVSCRFQGSSIFAYLRSTDPQGIAAMQEKACCGHRLQVTKVIIVRRRKKQALSLLWTANLNGLMLAALIALPLDRSSTFAAGTSAHAYTERIQYLLVNCFEEL